MRDGLLKLEGVCKRFRRGAAHDRLGELIVAGVRRLVGRPDPVKASDSFWALDEVSFEAKPGEAVGVIGPNGAGKSTALKLIAGIMRPNKGRIHTRGRVTALIEVSAGFHGDLSGRENVYMNASVLGMRKAEIDRKLDAIIDFSGVEEFIDTPVKRYSSGMQARLGFSVAAHVAPDVLLVDEVLSVGDVLFRQRCVQRMRELVDGGTILLFVSHHVEQMQSFCSRAIVLDIGRVIFDGDSSTAVAHYLSALRQAGGGADGHCAVGPEQITSLVVRSPGGRELPVARSEEPLEVAVTFQLSGPYAQLALEVDIRRELGSCLVNFSSIRDGETFAAPAGEGGFVLSVPFLPLGGGQYLLKAMLRDAASGKIVADSGYRYSVFIEDEGRPTGILCLPHSWSHNKGRTGTSAGQLIGTAG